MLGGLLMGIHGGVGLRVFSSMEALKVRKLDGQQGRFVLCDHNLRLLSWP